MAGMSTSGREVIKAVGRDILAAAGAGDVVAVETGVADDLSVVSFKVGSHSPMTRIAAQWGERQQSQRPNMSHSAAPPPPPPLTIAFSNAAPLPSGELRDSACAANPPSSAQARTPAALVATQTGRFMSRPITRPRASAAAARRKRAAHGSRTSTGRQWCFPTGAAARGCRAARGGCAATGVDRRHLHSPPPPALVPTIPGLPRPHHHNDSDSTSALRTATAATTATSTNADVCGGSENMATATSSVEGPATSPTAAAARSAVGAARIAGGGTRVGRCGGGDGLGCRRRQRPRGSGGRRGDGTGGGVSHGGENRTGHGGSAGRGRDGGVASLCAFPVYGGGGGRWTTGRRRPRQTRAT